jgi:hypothetical protein
VTGMANGFGPRGAPTQELVVVHVRDAINPTLAGRGDASYQSPPQPREDALGLVRLLVGRSEQPQTEEPRWTCPRLSGKAVTGEAVPRNRGPVEPAFPRLIWWRVRSSGCGA